MHSQPVTISKGSPGRGLAEHSSSRSGIPPVPGRPIRRAGQATGRPSAAAADLEVRPSESSGRPIRGPAECSSRAGSPFVRVVGPSEEPSGAVSLEEFKVRVRRRAECDGEPWSSLSSRAKQRALKPVDGPSSSRATWKQRVSKPVVEQGEICYYLWFP